MDPLRILLALVLALILADFPFQSDRMFARKRESALGSKVRGAQRLAAYAAHGVILFVVSFLLTLLLATPVVTWRILWLVVGVTLSHLILDFLKCRYVSRETLTILTADQALHVMIIITWMTALGIADLGRGWQWARELWLAHRDVVAVLAGGYVVSVRVGGICMRVFLDVVGKPVQTKESEREAGKRIGQLERFMITTLTVLDQYSAIGFVLAGKSIARFKKIEEDPTFAEYYLTGTLASVSFGVLTGLAIKGALALVQP